MSDKVVDEIREAIQGVSDLQAESVKVSRESTQMLFDIVKKLSERVKKLEERKDV